MSDINIPLAYIITADVLRITIFYLLLFNNRLKCKWRPNYNLKLYRLNLPATRIYVFNIHILISTLAPDLSH